MDSCRSLQSYVSTHNEFFRTLTVILTGVFVLVADLGLLLYWNVLLADSAEGAISPQLEVSSGNFGSGSGI
jgi:hypothetical protein